MDENRTQIIYGEDGTPAFAVIPYSLFEKLREPENEAELTDEELYDLAKATDTGPAIPHAVMGRLLNEENPVKVFREWRGLTQEALATRSGLTASHISQVERGVRTPSGRARMALARALEIPPEDLEPFAPS